ncbi:Crp/Fnr family transcriptional regulator [Thiospirochaeta perfilievii]|uniref:Crp/Fnr family transcriptional regulator n=1 Tax=Thiospirochaeta perfilievii TaxID=252967 RepID=A0A5C1QFH8_9SPIO|nr:Crp/Fnr family transcriptional regulator [Thiospirochaeta perfilievii]QEN06167.1 Crp/Fnr family transcriptional regulator [Thiospirochaeta perfilievii]
MDMSIFKKFEVRYSANEMIFCEFEPGNEFYLIQSGSVRVVKVINDVEKTLDVLKAGEFFGEMAILENAPRSASIIAYEDCVLLEFNKNNFEMLMKGQPQLAFNLLKILSKRIFDQRRRFMTLTIDDLEVKLYDVLLMLIEKQTNFGVLRPNTVIDANISDIAHWAGIPENECKSVLEKIVSKNKIEILRDQIVVKKPDSLKRTVSQYRKSN